MGTVGVGLYLGLGIAPNLPSCPSSDALPVAENPVMLDEVNLPTDELAVPFEIPLAQTAYASQIANFRISLVPPQVPFLIEKPQNKIVKAVGAVPEKPGRSSCPSPKKTVTRPTQPVLSVSVATVIWRLEPIEPIRKPTVFVDKAGK